MRTIYIINGEMYLCLSVQNFGAYSGQCRVSGHIVEKDGVSIQLQNVSLFNFNLVLTSVLGTGR